MPKITEMFAFVVSDPEGNDKESEGVPAFSPDGRMMLPMCGADLARVESLIPIAQDFADRSGKPVRIYKFSRKEQIGEVVPRDERKSS